MLSWECESASFFLRDNFLSFRSGERDSQNPKVVPFSFMPSGFDVAAAAVVADIVES